MRTDRRTYMTKLIVTFRNFANSPKKLSLKLQLRENQHNVSHTLHKGVEIYSWDMTLRQWVNATRRFQATYYPHFQVSKDPRKKNLLEDISTLEDDDTTLSRNFEMPLPSDTTSYPNRTEPSSSAVYIQIPSVYIFSPRESNLHAHTNSEDNFNHDVALTWL